MGPEVTKVQSQDDVRSFFDQAAFDYRDQHGDEEKLLRYRLTVITSLLGRNCGNSLLEIGCGTGIHLFALAGRFHRLIGTDLSPAMIDSARNVLRTCAYRGRVNLRVDAGERLGSVADASVDAVLCVGAFEHMLQKDQVLRQVYRVLGPNGRFVCLTPNGEFIWYRWISGWLGVNTRHLATDRFLTRGELASALQSTGFRAYTLEHWSFIPKGDVNRLTGMLLGALDRLGKLLRVSAFRGGICFCAVKSVG